MTKIYTEYLVSNRMTWGNGGHRSAKLVLLIDFKSHKDMGEVALEYKGTTKRMVCDSFSEAKTMYRAAMEWVEGEGSEDMFYWDGEDEDDEEEEGDE